MSEQVFIHGGPASGYTLCFPHGDYSGKIERLWVAIRLRDFWNRNPRLNRVRAAA